MDDKTSGKHIIKQGTILAAASVISRIIGMLYRSPMAAVIGDKGNGLYSFAFEIYSIALILSSYSMPLAVSKLLSARFAKKSTKTQIKFINLHIFCCCVRYGNGSYSFLRSRNHRKTVGP